MSGDRLPVGDLADPSGSSGPWTCPRCGRENKASWLQCPACESDRAGQSPAQRAPAISKSRTNPFYLVLGIVVLSVLVVVAVLLAEPLWAWAVEVWDTFVTWVDERT
jgi:hypothetical protein